MSWPFKSTNTTQPAGNQLRRATDWPALESRPENAMGTITFCLGRVGTGPRVYLAGPMSGLPYLNFPAFHAQAASLRAQGFDVVNPAEIDPVHGKPWEIYMRQDIAQLVTCQGIALMPGWEKSRGARLEAHIAEQLGMFRILLAAPSAPAQPTPHHSV